MSKKNFFLFFALVILIVAAFSYGKIYDYAGKKMIEQIVKEYNIREENYKPPENTAPVENGGEIAAEAEAPDEDSGFAQDGTEDNNGALPPNIMDHPYVKSIYNRFSASEIAQVSAMMTGGFTPEEKSRVKSIVMSKVTSDEINKLKEIYSLYYN